jgi:hypothetical protein
MHRTRIIFLISGRTEFMKRELCMVLLLCLAITSAIAQEAALPTVDQILEKFVEASGGKPANEKLGSRISEGSFEIPEMGVYGSLTIYDKAPNKRALLVEIPGFGTFKQGVDGEVAWEDNPMSGITVRSGAALAAAKRDAAFHREQNLRDHFKQIEVKGRQQIGEQEVYALEMTPEEGDPETWYFDVATGLLARVDAVRDGPQGSAQIQTSFKDYRETDGIKMPFRVDQVMPGMTFVTKLLDVRHNEEIDDALFAKP